MIEFESEALEKIVNELEGITDGVETVLSKASNKAAREAKKEAVQRIIENFYIDKSPVSSGIAIKNANSNNPLAEIKNNRKKDTFTLKQFKVDVPSNGPIRIGTIKSGGINELKRAFLNSKKDQPGNIQVFRRKGEKRYPIELQRSYSTGGMLQSEDVIDHLEESIEDKLENILGIELEKFFEK